MMTTIFAKKALLPDAWVDDLRVEIDAGRIGRLWHEQRPAADDVRVDCLIPGLCNSHSHAFQRALVGRTEQRSPAGRDNFWTWRERMYDLAAVMSAERFVAIARQAYVEMLSAGYTSVAEFHYLHREPGQDADDDTMFAAIRTAAADSGIRVTYVPVLYERSGFDQPDPQGSQRLFAMGVEDLLAHYERARSHIGERLNVGVGAHSIRAVSKESLAAIAVAATESDAPLHLHIAEQQGEVEQCLQHYGARPVRWLLDNFAVNSKWCLVHATHMDTAEIADLAASGAVVSLCPSTEANLGDGLFPLADFLRADGRIAIGSDSHVSINPFEELRWLEYGQRLATQSRNIATQRRPHVGQELFERAVDGGAGACGLAPAGIMVDAVADLVALYGDDPMLVGHDDASRLDALVFSGFQLPIEAVMVGGEWVVKLGRHRERDAARAAFAETIQAIRAAELSS